MKFQIETFTTLLILTLILLAGCSGCGVKSISEQAQSSVDTAQDETSIPKANPIQTAEKRGREVNSIPREKIAKLSPKNSTDLEYLATLKGVEYIEISREKKAGIPLPWDPIVVPIEWWINRVEKSGQLLIDRRLKKITSEEYNEIIFKHLREYGLVASMQLDIELRSAVSGKVPAIVDMAYAQNPDDFDTLLLWVLAGGNLVDLYGEEKTAATRRLSEMNPDHPWVLHKLAKCLLGHNPQEALGYAQKAQELDARYLPLGAEGLCYFQMGDYAAALASFRRSHQYAVETSQPTYIIGAIGFWVSTAKIVVDSGGEGEDGREKKRKAGLPLLGPDLPTMLYR